MKNDIMSLKQGYNVYLKYSTILNIKDESKKTDRTQSNIVQEAVDEYFAKRNLFADASVPAERSQDPPQVSSGSIA